MSIAIKNRLKELKDQKSYSIPAKRVMEHLKPILSKSNDLRKRWMWELLQNASDLGENIKSKFELTNDSLTFSHNGKPFTLAEAYNLIMPDSTKDDEIESKKSVIGQFGTGFISTHILSKNIEISGLIEDEQILYNFKFNLDRSQRTDKDFLIESIKNSEKEYWESLHEITSLPDKEFQTSFSYKIDDTYPPLIGNEIVTDGLESFKLLLPFVFSFRHQLSEIEIIDTIAKVNLRFEREQVSTNIDDLKIIKTTCFKDGQFESSTLIGNIIEGDTTIAFPITHINDNQYSLNALSENCPKLFCAFPMIGTNAFNFPVIIHSEKFIPNRERDGIEITEHDTDNRERLIEAKNALKKLFKTVEVFAWTNAYNICSFLSSEIDDVNTQKWFNKEIFIPVKDLIYNTKLIELDVSIGLAENRKSLRDILIPYADRRSKNKLQIIAEIFDFAFKIIPSEIPNKNHFINWYETIDFEVFSSEKLDIEKLCEMVSLKKGKLKDYSDQYKISEETVIQYFIELVDFILVHEKDELLNDYCLLLNQANEFVKIKGLKLDFTEHKALTEGYHEELKNIYHAISKSDCRVFLLHKDFEKINNLIDKEDKFSFDELARNTDEELRTYDGNFQDESFLLILRDIFHWYTTCGLSQDTLIKLFHYFSINKSQLYLNTKTPEELEFAFDIEISGKSEVLARLANSTLSESELELIVTNTKLVSSFMEWLSSKQEDNPDKELGNIGEEFLHHKLSQIFGEDRVLWEDKPQYDFRILEKDLISTKYYIDAKTTAMGIANSENIPFFMRVAQWDFLDEQQANDKYIIARIFMDGSNVDVRYLKLDIHSMQTL